MRSAFLWIAITLFGVASLTVWNAAQYFPSGSGNVPNNIAGPFAAGLAIAGGLALIAAALDRPR
jgi:hypothetical protein